MSAKETTQVGNSIIRTRAKRVTDFSSQKIKRVVTDLTDSMRKHNLVGMAAPQIGESLQIFVTEVRNTKLRNNSETDELRIFINPKIVSVAKKTRSDWEGCGSVASAGLFAKVKRSTSVEIEAFDETGEKFSIRAQGLLARIVQHEVDHLQGIVFTDKADMKTVMSKSEYLKFQK